MWYNHMMQYDESYRTDCEPIDWPEFERWMQLTPGQRLYVARNARRRALGLMRGRLRRQHPDLSDAEITWKLLAELAHDD